MLKSIPWDNSWLVWQLLLDSFWTTDWLDNCLGYFVYTKLFQNQRQQEYLFIALTKKLLVFVFVFFYWYSSLINGLLKDIRSKLLTFMYKIVFVLSCHSSLNASVAPYIKKTLHALEDTRCLYFTVVKFEIMLVFLLVSKLLESQVYLRLRLVWISGLLEAQVRLKFGFTWSSGLLDARVHVKLRFAWCTGSPEAQASLEANTKRLCQSEPESLSWSTPGIQSRFHSQPNINSWHQQICVLERSIN